MTKDRDERYAAAAALRAQQRAEQRLRGQYGESIEDVCARVRKTGIPEEHSSGLTVYPHSDAAQQHSPFTLRQKFAKRAAKVIAEYTGQRMLEPVSIWADYHVEGTYALRARCTAPGMHGEQLVDFIVTQQEPDGSTLCEDDLQDAQFNEWPPRSTR